MSAAIAQLCDYIADSARRLPNKVALVCGNRRSTYAELDSSTNALANAPIERGVTRGNRVMTFADNIVETVVSFWAVLKASARAKLLEHEPREAFDAGPYGLKIHQRVAKEAVGDLQSGGALMFEFGAGQEKQISIPFARTKAYGDERLVNDADGVPRVALAAKL